MAYMFRAEIAGFHDLPIDEQCAYVIAWAKALCTTDYLWLKAMQKKGTPAPLLYQSGVIYQDQIRGHDEWLDIRACLERGFGACEDLAAWRVAELCLAGERAKLDVDTSSGAGLLLFHVVVRRGNGVREDPSRLLGMP